MLFILLVSLLLLLLLFTGQLFFVFCDIFKVQFFRVFYFHPPLPWSYVHTLILIMVVIPQIASLLPSSVFFYVILLFLRRARNNLLFLNHPPKQNIVPWHLLPKIVWLRWLLADIRVSFSHPTFMYCNNQSSIQITHNLVFHERTKYIEIDCHLTRHHLKHGTITLPFVSSSLQIADFFTKMHSIFHFRFLVGNSQCL